MTFRAASIGGNNWRAGHALVSLLLCAGFVLHAGWLVFKGAQLQLVLFELVISAGGFGLWRYLLPEAAWRSRVQKALQDAKRKHKKVTR